MSALSSEMHVTHSVKFSTGNSHMSYLWLTSMTAMAGAQRHGTPRISWGFSMPVKFVVTNPNYGEGPPQP